MKIYAVEIEDICEARLQELSLRVDGSYKRKIEKFFYKKDKIRTLIGQILIRRIISDQLKLRNEDIVFKKNKYGKPYLENCSEFHFNISHSGDIVVCAVHEMPVGIDIEQVLYIEDYVEIAESCYTEKEISYIAKTGDNSLSRFYDIWTLKESYIKCHGKGLAIPLKSFSIDITDRAVTATINGENSNYLFKNFSVISSATKVDALTSPKLQSVCHQNSTVFQALDARSDYRIAVCTLCGNIPNNLIWENQNRLIK